METGKDIKTRRPRRSKADIEAAIHKAAISQIKKKGFAGALVTDIVKRARIEPIVFYNRFKNLEEFYDVFVKRYDYWMSDMVRGFSNDFSTAEGYVAAMDTLLDALLDDGLMAELLRWEVAEGNPITERTAKVRELDLSPTIERFEQTAAVYGNDGIAISALAVAGIYFLVLHKDRSTFAGIDINSQEGKDRIHQAFRQLAQMLYEKREQQETRHLKLRECLRREGLSPEAISRCIDSIND